MGSRAFDITMIGDRELDYAYDQLEKKTRRKFLSTALRESAYRLRKLVAAAAPVKSGRLKKAMATARVVVTSKRAGFLRLGFVMPTREMLGIPPRGEKGGSGYYPFTIEYGSMKLRRAAIPWIRFTVDQHMHEEWSLIGADLVRMIEGDFKRSTRKKFSLRKGILK